jgi:hypothetical protein
MSPGGWWMVSKVFRRVRHCRWGLTGAHPRRWGLTGAHPWKWACYGRILGDGALLGPTLGDGAIRGITPGNGEWIRVIHGGACVGNSASCTAVGVAGCTGAELHGEWNPGDGVSLVAFDGTCMEVPVED